MGCKFVDNSNKILKGMKESSSKALEMCGLTGEGYAKKLCPVDTGMLRNSISHLVDAKTLTAYIGTNMEYAPYVELGTGKYYAGGRKTPWVYQDAKGNWHMTDGQRAQPYLKPAIGDHISTYISIIQSELRNG